MRFVYKMLFFYIIGLCSMYGFSKEHGQVFQTNSVDTTKPLDLMDIYNLALKNDAQLAAAKAQFLATKENIPIARSVLLPNIQLQAQTQWTRAKKEVVGAENLYPRFNKNGWSATLNQPIFQLDSIFGVKQAKYQVKKAFYDYQSVQQNLILQVATAYFNVLRSQDSLKTNQAEELALKQQLDQALERFKVGLIAKTDVLEARAAYDKARVARIVAENQVSLSYENLRTITAEPIDMIGELENQMPITKPSPEKPNLWVEATIKSNLDLKSTYQSIAVAKQAMNIQKSQGFSPSLGAFVTYSHGYDGSTKGPLDPGPGIMNGRQSSTVFGLNVTLPVFSGGGSIAQIHQSQYKLEQAQKLYDQFLRTTVSKTRNMLRTVNSDVESIIAGKQEVISAQSALDATQSGYEVGTRNIIDVLNAQQRVYASMRDYLNSRYNFIIDTLTLKQLSGRLSEKDLQALNQWITFQHSKSLLYNTDRLKSNVKQTSPSDTVESSASVDNKK